jgi:serine/threonine protein phosphatase PrpC
MSQPFSLGYSSLTGPRERNEDFCGAMAPESEELENKGLLAAVADGVGGRNNGREASEYVVRGLLADYYATPDTWGVFQSFDTVIQSLNRWLVAQSASAGYSAGMATTLSALLLRGDRYHFAHVGDSRIYRFHQRALQRLTQDHVWEHPELDTVLSRAIGLDNKLSVDYGDGELAVGDSFLICSDGVWHALGDRRLSEMLASYPDDPQKAAERITHAALALGSKDNSTAMVLSVHRVTPERLRDSLMRTSKLPVPRLLMPGEELDGLEIVRLMHESPVTLRYHARLKTSGQLCILKTLTPESDSSDAVALAHEEWLARRVTHVAFPQVIPAPGRSWLYYLVTWHDGATLGQWLKKGRRFSPAEATELGTQLLKGIGALHRLGIIHGDIKPDHLLLEGDGHLRILGMGAVTSDSATVDSDLYACGSCLYELLTRKIPNGETDSQRPVRMEPVSPSRYRPDIPEWLESILLKALALNPKDRFETAEEFLLALEKGSSSRLRVPRKAPLSQRDPALMLKIVAAASLLLNIVLVYWLLA